jgi:predicted nucleic-acid-binding Zn-ribbon protein
MCPKCGSSKIEAQVFGVPVLEALIDIVKGTLGEISWICKQCGYRWKEKEK